MPSINWSKIDPILIDLVKKKRTNDEINQVLFLSKGSIQQRIGFLGLLGTRTRTKGEIAGKNYGLKSQRFRSEHISRNCLQCGRKYSAETRFLRLCPNCRRAAK